jgi:hypothetical protein
VAYLSWVLFKSVSDMMRVNGTYPSCDCIIVEYCTISIRAKSDRYVRVSRCGLDDIYGRRRLNSDASLYTPGLSQQAKHEVNSFLLCTLMSVVPCNSQRSMETIVLILATCHRPQMSKNVCLQYYLAFHECGIDERQRFLLWLTKTKGRDMKQGV